MAALRLLWLVAFPLEAAAAWLLFLEPTGGLIAAVLPLHVLAAALFGFSLQTTRGTQPRWAWPTLGGTIALLGFPLVGMLAAAIAFTLTHTVRFQGAAVAAHLQRVADTDERSEGAVEQAHQLEVALMDELEIEPVVDVLREDDPELKRAAIEAITQQRSAETVRLLRSLLHDQSAEARFFSSIALSKLEDEISRAILAAQRTVKESADDGAAREQLAQLYLDYAVSGFLEGVTREYYLDLARQTFEEALPTSGAPDAVRRRLAYIHLLLGNIAEAALLLEDLAAARPDDLDVHLLRMDAIYQFRDFRELALYAQRTVHAASIESDEAELIEWWASAGRPEVPVGR
jgi:hypothetical protein